MRHFRFLSGMASHFILSRRQAFAGAGLACLAPLTLKAAADTAPNVPTGLCVNGLADLLGSDTLRPSFGWQCPSGQMQAAYRILVATSPERLRQQRPDLWDSGRVNSAECTGIVFAGASLSSRQRCYWTVMIWDSSGQASPFAQAESWEMGLLSPRDWLGEWLAAETADERADRLAKPLWVMGTTASITASRSFRLCFDCDGDGQLVATIAVAGLPFDLALDGVPLQIPDRDKNAFGDRPAFQIDVPVSSGPHVLTVSLAPVPGYFARPIVKIAGLLRVGNAHGIQRIANGWEVQTGHEQMGAWAKAELATEQADFPWPPGPATLLRRRFSAREVPVKARLYIAALGCARAYVNGRRIGSDELQSEPSDYRVRIPYRVYDVSGHVRKGENALAAVVGDGWYASYQAPTGRFSFGPAPRRALFQLELIFADGRRETVAGDDQWRTSTGAIRSSSIYEGELQDRREEPERWADVDYDDAAWTQALAAPPVSGRLVAREVPPIRVLKVLRPISVRSVSPDTHIVDFGQNFAGRVRIRMKGARGAPIRVRHAEILDDQGRLDVRNLRAANATDTYILAGGGSIETLEPIFTYHGFRYAEITCSGKLDVQQVEGVVLGSDLGEVGTFSVDEPTVQKIWSNTLWSQRANFMGIPTDCPQRDERLGWTADAQVFWHTAAYNMAIGPFTRGFMANLRDAQAANGAFPLWAPNRDGLGWETKTATPGWADAGVMLPYVAYLHTGDRLLVDENWEAMNRYLAGVFSTNPDGLWLNGRGIDLGDWLSLDAKAPLDETTPRDLIGTAMLARSVAQVAQMAEWTGREADALGWRGKLETVKAAFMRRYVSPDGRVGNGSHSSYILALQCGLISGAFAKVVAARLAEDIVRRGKLLTTGFLGTPLALDALADHGQEQLAIDLLLRDQYPSWGYMARRGATTIWERWNSDVGDVAMNSYNHYALGAVSAFLYRRIAGLEVVSPGCARIRIAPLLDPRIGSASANYGSVRGKVAVAWRAQGAEMIDLSVTLPGNIEAEVILPGSKPPLLLGPGTHRIAHDRRAASTT